LAEEIIRDRMALNVTLRGRRRLNASIGIGRIEVDDVAQKNLAVVKLITPDGDSVKRVSGLSQSPAIIAS
jgi:hypothetical protein